jgi:hypothetical protein
LILNNNLYETVVVVFQGVETASQIRYVTYYERLKKMKLQYPIDVSVAIKAIQITGSTPTISPTFNERIYANILEPKNVQT